MIEPVLHYYPMPDGVVAFSTTRHGGVSKGKLATLNINPYRGDDAASVAANLRAVAAEIGTRADRVVRLHQIHETHCLQVTDAFFRLPAAGQSGQEEGKDAVVTDCRNVCIGVHTADCVPVLFYDPVHHAIGAAHAGWRGTVKRIVQHTVQRMAACYGTDAKDLKVVIGPAISEKNFEVGQEVYDAFAAAGFPMDRIARMHEKWHIDLPLCNQLQLEEMGVATGHIHQSGICTYDNSTDFFSARILKEGFGTIYTGIMLPGSDSFPEVKGIE
ncbi:MAG: peptidoglycan editing factor PgeF [Prevotella sp.]|nr:peptidoglycan editing factor PgeF [Prevotella sp.]